MNERKSQTLALDKWRTKAVLAAAGLPVPAGIIIPVGTQIRPPFPAPWMVKPLFTDASEGIHPASVVQGDVKALARAIRLVHRDFKHPALVEQFFGSREINIAVFQRGNRIQVMPVAEIEFRGYGEDRPRIIDYAAKWHTDSFEYKNTVRVVPANVPKAVAIRLRAAALSAWHTLGCRDYARVDFRLDDNGRFVILEVNPNPDISPDSGFEAALKASRIPYREFVRSMCSNAAARRQKRVKAAAGVQPKVGPPSAKKPALPVGTTLTKQQRERTAAQVPFIIRPSQASYRDGILDFMRGTGFFNESEIEVAAEVLDEAIAKGPSGHYQSFTLMAEGQPYGWVCYGPTPCTTGTFDVYWIGVSAQAQGRGYGRALLEHAETLIRKRQGRQVIIETSGRPLYEATRGFYLKTGYIEAARISEFYAPGDDRVIYSKKV